MAVPPFQLAESAICRSNCSMRSISWRSVLHSDSQRMSRATLRCDIYLELCIIRVLIPASSLFCSTLLGDESNSPGNLTVPPYSETTKRCTDKTMR